MIETSAPSNIALIKYMGKSSLKENKASNPSLSITTEHLRTFIRIEPADKDMWQPLEGYESLVLDEEGQTRYLNFLNDLKKDFSIKEPLKIQSANNFPSDAGLASSASSFAALTKACFLYAKKNNLTKIEEKDLPRISQKGSGSSCRSFFSPASIWEPLSGVSIYEKVPKLIHLAIIIKKDKKKVSSSEAHKLVPSSLLFEGRDIRAKKRMKDLQLSFEKNEWRKSYEICWQEFWDMHALFETSTPPFFYMTESTLKVLRSIAKKWDLEGNGPLVTMDAGPNVHLFFKKEDQDLYQAYKNELKKNYQLIGEI